LFTQKQYEYCKNRNAPIAIIYYDTKTSEKSQKLYEAAFFSLEKINSIRNKLQETEKFRNGYCCLFALDRSVAADGDLNYFINNVLKKSSNGISGKSLAVLIMCNNGKIACQPLPEISSVIGLTEALYEKCESGKDEIARFGDWAGRNAWIDRQPSKPDPETVPTSTTPKNDIITAIAAMDGIQPPYYENPSTLSGFYDYGGDSDFSGIETKNKREDGSNALLDLTNVSTPETTYFLYGSYDKKHPTNAVKQSDSVLRPRIERYCDNIKSIWNRDCINNDGFKNLFFDGKKYRYFIFYEHSHGNDKKITIGISYAEIWNMFSELSSSQRVWGMFDSCKSGSMIEPASLAAPSPSGREENIIEYLDRKFKDRSEKLAAKYGITAAAAAAAYNPKMALWSASQASNNTIYTAGKSTEFLNGFSDAMQETRWKTPYKYSDIRYGNSSEQAFKEITAKNPQRGSAVVDGKTQDITWVPQCKNFPDENKSFKTNIIFC